MPPAAREHWLSQLAPAHLTLQPLLRDFLAKHAAVETDDFLETLPKFTAAGNDLRRTTPNGFESGAIIGPYQLVRELGHGGMAEVWLATRRDGALNRPVALKLPHAHLLSGALRQRFERERDILAPLSHPHIAPLYDAGVSDGGHPYLAMEWIDGAPITLYCREVLLPIAARLELFKQVLEAVRYAHERFIAHRDLKPSNILVTPDGQVKLLDFGIAKSCGCGVRPRNRCPRQSPPSVVCMMPLLKLTAQTVFASTALMASMAPTSKDGIGCERQVTPPSSDRSMTKNPAAHNVLPERVAL